MNFYKIFIGLIIIIASAYASFTIPVTDTGIPFTLQSLAVFVVAAFLGPKESLLCLLSYLILGAVGAPVFADGSSGYSKLLGASGGFLFGFVFAGTFISFIVEKIDRGKLMSLVILMIVSTVILFAFGLLQLTVKLDAAKAIEYGLIPFWKMGLVKACIAGLCVWVIQKVVSPNLH
jgi:biotin transport system substrate-specific component